MKIGNLPLKVYERKEECQIGQMALQHIFICKDGKSQHSYYFYDMDYYTLEELVGKIKPIKKDESIKKRITRYLLGMEYDMRYYSVELSNHYLIKSSDRYSQFSGFKDQSYLHSDIGIVHTLKEANSLAHKSALAYGIEELNKKGESEGDINRNNLHIIESYWEIHKKYRHKNIRFNKILPGTILKEKREGYLFHGHSIFYDLTNPRLVLPVTKKH